MTNIVAQASDVANAGWTFAANETNREFFYYIQNGISQSINLLLNCTSGNIVAFKQEGTNITVSLTQSTLPCGSNFTVASKMTAGMYFIAPTRNTSAALSIIHTLVSSGSSMAKIIQVASFGAIALLSLNLF